MELTVGSVLSCSCVEEYKLAPDGKSCLMLSDVCEGPKCLKPESKFNDTLFGEMLHGYNNQTQHVNQGQVFQMTFRYGADTCASVVELLSQIWAREEAMGIHGPQSCVTGQHLPKLIDAYPRGVRSQPSSFHEVPFP